MPPSCAARRAVIDADGALRAYEHRYLDRAQAALVEAFAVDLGLAPDELEPRMAAAATMTVFQLLGRDVDPARRRSGLEALDRALVFIGGGIGALRGQGTRRRGDGAGRSGRHRVALRSTVSRCAR